MPSKNMTPTSECPCCQGPARRIIQTGPVHVGQFVPVVDDLIAVIGDDDEVVALADTNHQIVATGRKMARYVTKNYGCTTIAVREISKRSLAQA